MADPFDYKALVMPDNTPAMLHLYDQFQKQQQLRDAKKTKEAEEELKRKEALAKNKTPIWFLKNRASTKLGGTCDQFSCSTSITAWNA